MHFLIIGLIILLSGCANTSMGNQYAETVQSWNGGNEKAMLARWGKPDEEINASNGHKFFLYKTQSYATYNTAQSTLTWKFLPTGKLEFIRVPNNSWSRGSKSVNCITAFEANKRGQIVDTQVIGNRCYADATFASNHVNPKIMA